MNSPADTESESVITLEQALTTAISLQQAKDWQQAEAIYQLILEQLPGCPEALHFLGLLNCQTGKIDEGIALIQRALHEKPDYADAHNNLGNVFQIQGQLEQAVDAYRSALAIHSDNIAAWNNLGVVLKDLERYEEAIEACRHAIDLMPENSGFHRNLGNVYKHQGNFVEAITAYRMALKFNSYNADDYENLCAVLYLQGDVEQGILLVNQWLEQDPENPLALHRLASFSGEHLSKASDEYISQTFDSFADSFDHVLKRLEYKAPFLVADALAQYYPKPDGSLSILDAGCGTGLCGPLIKACAQNLVGVDLSAKMLDRAVLRNCYHELVRSELVAWMAAQQDAYDVIISADTLVYLGDLSDVCKMAAQALKAQGYLIFTVESCTEALEAGFKINLHGRFSHTEAYLQRVLADAQFSVLDIKPVVLRYEISAPVNGLLVVARVP